MIKRGKKKLVSFDVSDLQQRWKLHYLYDDIYKGSEYIIIHIREFKLS